MTSLRALLDNARSLYHREQPDTDELAKRVKQNLVGSAGIWPKDRDPASLALSELVKRAHGHVPAEALAACQAKLEQTERRAEMWHNTVNAELRRVEEARADRDRLAAEVEHLQRLIAATRRDKDRIAQQRDRLAAALERIVGLTEHWGEPWTRSDCLRVAREALAQAPQKQAWWWICECGNRNSGMAGRCYGGCGKERPHGEPGPEGSAFGEVGLIGERPDPDLAGDYGAEWKDGEPPQQP